ncbi:MAG: ROK family protein [Chloroflexota bacterium]
MLTRRSHPHLVVVADLGPLRLRVAALLGGRLGKVTTYRTADLDPTADGERPANIVPGLIAALRAAVPAGERIDLVGIGVTASVDARGRIAGPRPPGVPEGLLLREALESALGAPVLVDRSASLAALGEARQGAARGARDVVLLLLDSEISLGIVADGRIVRGAHGAAGAAGRLLLPAHRGVTGRDTEARVPRIGAGLTDAPTGYVYLDNLVSGTGLTAIFTDGTRPLELRPEVADRRGKAATRQAIEGWALLVAELAALLDPEIVVLGGGLITTAPGLAEQLRRRVAEFLPSETGIAIPDIRLGRLGPRAALIGAAIAARLARNTGLLRAPAPAPAALPGAAADSRDG